MLQDSLLSEDQGGNKIYIEQVASGKATCIPSVLEYVDTSNSQVPLIVKENYNDFARDRKALLDLISKSQQSIPRHSCWGMLQRKKLFRYTAGNKILEGGSIIDRYVGVENASMLTLTLPGNTPQSMSAIARWSGWIVNRMLQVIRRLKKYKDDIYWFFVWEHQKRGALHMHLCLAWDIASGVRKALAMAIKRMFYRCLLELQDKDNVDCFARQGFQGSWRNKPSKWQYHYADIEKSVAGYFAKYCQKNTKVNGTDADSKYQNAWMRNQVITVSNADSIVYYPSRYWGSSSNIKRISKKLSKTKKIETGGELETEMVRSRIIDVALLNESPVSISETEFQIQSDYCDAIIASGTTLSVRFAPEDYPSVWARVVTLIMEKDICMDADMEKFFLSGRTASMQ